MGVDCEKTCRQWTIGKFVSDDSTAVAKDECRKNHHRILAAPWIGRTIIERKSDEFEGHVMLLTQSEETLVRKSCVKSWRGTECKFGQHRILATKTSPHGRKHRTLQEEKIFDFRKSAVRRLVSAELRRSSPDSDTVHPPDVSCRSHVSIKGQQKARNMCKPLVNHVCKVILELLKGRESRRERGGGPGGERFGGGGRGGGGGGGGGRGGEQGSGGAVQGGGRGGGARKLEGAGLTRLTLSSCLWRDAKHGQNRRCCAGGWSKLGDSSGGHCSPVRSPERLRAPWRTFECRVAQDGNLPFACEVEGEQRHAGLA